MDLRPIFVKNGIDLEFAKELIYDEMEEFGISSARDRLKLKRALRTLWLERPFIISECIILICF